MKKHLPSVNIGKFFWLLCLSFCLSLLSNVVKAVELSGIYTIDSSQVSSATNFKNLTSAIAYLTGFGTRTDGGVNNIAPFGVNGPVVFNIRSGTYKEQVTFYDRIPGASLSNTITFQSQARYADSVVITHNCLSLSADSNYVVKIIKASYLMFREITFTAYSDSLGLNTAALRLKDSASYNTWYGCRFNDTKVKSNNNAGGIVIGEDLVGTNINFIKNIFNGITLGITLQSNHQIENVTIDSNIFIRSGISLYDVRNVKIRANEIRMDSSSLYFTGINISSGNDSTAISGNKIIINDPTGKGSNPHGIDLRYTNAMYHLIVNNDIAIITTRAAFGIEGSNNCLYQEIYHNSVNVKVDDAFPTLSAYAGSFTKISGASLKIKNNIFSFKNNEPAVNMLVLRLFITSTGLDIDYNHYDASFPGLIEGLGTKFSTIATWKASSGQDLHSVFVPSPFLSDTDLRLKTNCSTIRGISLPNIITDIEARVRASSPIVGAYEQVFNNDLALIALIQPTSFSIGLQDIKIQVQNMGINTIDSFTMAYKLNGGPEITQLSIRSIPRCNIDTVTFTGASFIDINDLMIYSSLPNNTTDGNPTNDTLELMLSAGLSGIYTIGGISPDFVSFKTAIDTLKQRGAVGPVIFNVRNGIYTEQINMVGPINGASEINTITFQSETAQADSVVINYFANSTHEDTNYVVNVGAASYMIFRNLTLTALSTINTTVLRFSGEASFNRVLNCKLNSAVTTTEDPRAYVVSVTGSGSSNTFVKNTFSGGSKGLFISGISSANQTGNLIIDSNIFLNNGWGIHLSHTYNVKVSRNDVFNFSGYGIHADIDSALEVSNNKINTSVTSSGNVIGIYMGVYSDDSNLFINHTRIVANNSIIISNAGPGLVNGIFTLTFYLEHYHNSVYVISEQTNSAALKLSSWTPRSGGRIKNNIFACVGGSAGGFAIDAEFVTSFVDEANYNDLYSSGVNIVRMGYPSVTFNNLATWRTTSGRDLNSISLIPDFLSETDLHLVSSCGMQAGVYLPGFPLDIEGNTRLNPPTIGAYESQGLNNNLAIRSLLQPVVPFDSSMHEIIVAVQNIGANPVTFYDVVYKLNGGAAVVQPVAGSLIPCGIDTITITGVTFTSSIDLTVYSTLPNGLADSDPTNDTIKVTLLPPLNGVYNIGGISPHFTTFTDAAFALNLRGISGPVTLNVPAGATFTENPVVLNHVPGADLYPVVFQKSGVGLNPVILGINGAGNSDAVVTIKGTNNITFNGIDVANDISNPDNNKRMEYGYAILNLNPSVGSSNNIIKNIKITLNRVNASSIGILQSASAIGGGFAPLSFSGSNHNNRYENIRVENSYNGMLLAGNFIFPDSNNIITSSGTDTTVIGSTTTNDIGNGSTTVYGIRLDNQKNVEVSNCIVRNATTSNTLIHGIYLNNTSSGTILNQDTSIIKNNRVYNIRRSSTSTTASGGVHGIRIDIATNAVAYVFNNLVQGLSSGNTTSPNTNIFIKGITHCQSGGGYGRYFNNTVQITSGTTLNISSAAFWKGSGLALIINNVLINRTAAQTGAAKHYAVYTSSPFFLEGSNNLLWSSGANGFIGFYAGDRKTLPEWKTSSGQDMHSLSYLPNLTANLQPVPTDTASWALNGRGIHLAEVTIDINGDPKPASVADGVPDIGAYEFTPTSVPPLAIAVGSLALDSTQIFLFGEDTVAIIKWDIGSTNLPTGIEVRQYTGTQPPFTPSAINYMYVYTDIKALGAAATYSANLGMYYQDAWIGTNPLEADVRMTQHHNSIWNTPSTMASVSTDVFRNILEADYLTSFGLFTGTDQFNSLPVKLLNLTAHKEGSSVKINWSTASEINISFFEIERSTNGRLFDKIGTAVAKGNANNITNYELTDPLSFPIPTLYYRLKIIDKDGGYDYSRIISIKTDDELNQKGMVYPNPFSSELLLSIYSDTVEEISIKVSDITGKVLLLETSTLQVGTNVTSVKGISSFRSGIYFISVEVRDAKRTLMIKRVIKH